MSDKEKQERREKIIREWQNPITKPEDAAQAKYEYDREHGRNGMK